MECLFKICWICWLFVERESNESHERKTSLSHTESTENTEIHWFIREYGIGYLYNKTNELVFLQIEPIKDDVLVRCTLNL